MSDYTTQLRWPVEQKQRETMSNPDDYSKCYEMLGLADYPIFDESYRAGLNDKIIRHFYFREIGFETLAQFRWYVRNTMWEHMPYFNQLYNSLNLITDPITNQKYTWGELYSLAQGGTTSTDVRGTSHDEDTINTDTNEVTTYGKTDDTTTTYGKTDDTTTTYGKTDDTTTTYGKTDDTTTTYGKTDNTTTNYGKVDTETTVYGKTDDTTTTYGKTDTEETTYGKGGSEIIAYGKTTSDTTTTSYGRTQHTANGGSDETTEGAVHERVIREDTPQNLIPNGAIENLNYATDVTYTDREGTGAGVTEYGGTTDISNGGQDSTSSSGSTGGRDTKTTTTSGKDTTVGTLGGCDSVSSETGGQDVKTDRLSGSDTVNNTLGGSDTVNKEQGGSDTVNNTLGGSDTVNNTLGGSDTVNNQLGGADEKDTEVDTSKTHDGTTTSKTGFSRELDESGNRSHNRIGYDGISPSDLLQKYRETFLNVDLQVIASLETCFFGLWN